MFLTAVQSENARRRRVIWWRVSLGLIVLFVAIWMLGKAMQRLSPWYETRSLSRDHPILGKLPSALPDKSMAPLSGFRVEIFGLAFQTPWSHIGTMTIRMMASNEAMIPFPDQHVAMTLFRPSSDDFEKRMFAEAVHARDDATVISNYKLVAAEMLTTPDDVKWWKSYSQNEARTFLLEMKSLRIGDLNEIYSIDFGNLKGFQVGNPSLPPYQIRLDLFDVSDRHYQIRIASTDNHGPIISQAQINAIAASVHQAASP